VFYRRLAYLPDRRSTRVEQSVPIMVSGLDSSRGAYREQVYTVSMNCHGCRYRSANRVAVGEMAILEVAETDAKSPALARVRSVRQVPDTQSSFEVAVEFDLPRNLWSIASPPADWVEFEPASASGEALPALPIHALPTVQVRRAEKPKMRRSFAGPVLIRKVLVDVEEAVLPPLPAHLTSTLREPPQPAGTHAGRIAPLARGSRGSLDEVCSSLEDKVSQIFEGVIASFTKEMDSCPRQPDQLSPSQAFEDTVCAFGQAASNSNRRLA
jgi:hypothetical protein